MNSEEEYEKFNDIDFNERKLFYIKKRGCLKKYEDYKNFEAIFNNLHTQNLDVRTYLTMALTFEKKKYEYDMCMKY